MQRCCVSLVALASRWREFAFRVGAVLGVAIAAKLFLWPLIFWLLGTRRYRAALAASAAALAAILVPWAVIGFSGLASYPDLLRVAEGGICHTQFLGRHDAQRDRAPCNAGGSRCGGVGRRVGCDCTPPGETRRRRVLVHDRRAGGDPRVSNCVAVLLRADFGSARNSASALLRSLGPARVALFGRPIAETVARLIRGIAWRTRMLSSR